MKLPRSPPPFDRSTRTCSGAARGQFTNDDKLQPGLHNTQAFRLYYVLYMYLLCICIILYYFNIAVSGVLSVYYVLYVLYIIFCILFVLCIVAPCDEQDVVGSRSSAGDEADPTKNGLRHARFPAPLVTPAFGFLCFYGIYYMKGRHRRARFVRIVHYTRLLIFTVANDTHNRRTSTRKFSSSLRSRGP